jgi:hypothetical protein
MAVEKETMYVDIKSCARCGGNHVRSLFTRFVNAPLTIENSTFRFWGVCPVHGEPILMNIVSGN